MNECIRCWETFKDCEAEVVEWLQCADKMFSEKIITTKSNLEMHKVIRVRRCYI